MTSRSAPPSYLRIPKGNTKERQKTKRPRALFQEDTLTYSKTEVDEMLENFKQEVAS